MATRNSNRLSVLSIKKISEPCKYGDRYRLYLVVAESGAKRWEQRITINGKRHDLGLQSFPLLSLEEVTEVSLHNKRNLAFEAEKPLDTFLRFKSCKLLF